MTIKQLKYFTAVVECGNISQAAKKLHIAQPPLSAQIKLLEDEYGVTLFERGARSVTLTKAGEYLCSRALKILADIDETENELSDFSKDVKGTLKIGSISPSGVELLGKYIYKFQSLYPYINFEIKEEHTDVLIDMILKENIELAIVRTPFCTNGIDCFYLNYEPMYAVASDKFFQAADKTIDLDELMQYPLIYHRRFEELISSVFNSANLSFTPYCVNDDGRTSLSLALSEIGCAIVTQSTLPKNLPDNIHVRKINNNKLNTRLALIHKSDKRISKSAKLFTEHFIKGL